MVPVPMSLLTDPATWRDLLWTLVNAPAAACAVSLARRARDEPLGRLTPREREVLALMAEGRTNAGIASRLVVSEKAVSKHINNIFTKLDLYRGGDDNRRVLAVLTYLNV